jgi:DNA primase
MNQQVQLHDLISLNQMSSAAETIKDRLGIVEVVSSYIKIDKAGGNYKGRCPFHHEKTPSFFVSPARNSYYCFGCGQKGDIFTFVQEFEKVDFIGALKILAEKAGIELQQFKNENKGENDRLRSILDTATKFYEQSLHAPRNAKALEYLRERGLTDKTIDDWRIGFAENEWRKLHDFLLTKNMGQIDMEKVGLIKRSDKEGARPDAVYDRFRARIMFPLFDPSSRVIGYSGRIFGVPDADGPKYLNSPDTVLFNKSETLYGYHKAKDGIREWRYAILVEGQMDLLMCHQSGFTNTVATSGTSLTNQHLEKLQKLSDNLMLVYDADKAGLKATLRAWTSALALGMDVKVASMPTGEDPASLLLKDKDAFKNGIKHAKHIIDYYIDILVKEGLEGKQFKKSVEKEVLPYVAVVDSAIERSNFISKVSVKTGIYESDIREEVDKIRSNPNFKDTIAAGGGTGSGSNASGAGTSKNGAGTSRGDADATGDSTISYSKDNRPIDDIVLRRVGALIVWLKNSHKEKGQELHGKRVEEILEKISRILPQSEFIYFKHSVESSPEELIFEAEMLFDGSKKIDQDIQDLLYELEERTLKQRLSDTMRELGMVEKKKDIEKAEELLKICQEISLKLSELNKRKEG